MGRRICDNTLAGSPARLEPPGAGQLPPRTGKQEGNTMKEFEMRYVGSHVEVYSSSGVFLFSADTVREAMEELEA